MKIVPACGFARAATWVRDLCQGWWHLDSTSLVLVCGSRSHRCPPLTLPGAQFPSLLWFRNPPWLPRASRSPFSGCCQCSGPPIILPFQRYFLLADSTPHPQPVCSPLPWQLFCVTHAGLLSDTSLQLVLHVLQRFAQVSFPCSPSYCLVKSQSLGHPSPTGLCPDHDTGWRAAFLLSTEVRVELPGSLGVPAPGVTSAHRWLCLRGAS